MTATVRFDDALAIALGWVRDHRPEFGDDALLLRDMTGHLRVLTRGNEISESTRESLHAALGAFSAGPRGLFLDRSLVGTEDELRRDHVTLDGVGLIDRLVSEQGWNRPPVEPPPSVPRVTFFGIKGGVGRTTALVALAQRLARDEQRVLVVDLDLESPGATGMLLKNEELPSYGVADWMVEDAVGQADDDLLDAMVVTAGLASARRRGEVLVAPAVGALSLPLDEPGDVRERLRDGGYVAKLGRAYTASAGDSDFAARLGRMLAALEARHRPDYVLIDSRAGMHDISAAAVPRLGSTVLLFAGASSQTWLGYRLLFSAWRRDRSVLTRFRDRLRLVASQVPESGRGEYEARVRENGYDLFASFVYDSEEREHDAGGSEEERFNYDLGDQDAPHAPLPIYWRRELVEWEPARGDGLTPEQYEAAFSPFLKGVLSLPYVRAPRAVESSPP